MPGIKFTIGNSNTPHSPAAAFTILADQIESVKEKLGGHLSEPFTEIAEYLVGAIQDRFDAGHFNDNYRSSITNQVRQAKGQDPDGNTLVASGRLKKSIKPVFTGRKNEDGGNRIVNILRIGSVGTPYARVHLEGGTWEVPGFRAPNRKDGAEGWFYPDMDSIEGTKIRNQAFYGKKWKNIQGYGRETYSMDVPSREFLGFTDEDNKMINSILVKFLNRSDIIPF